MDLQHPNNGVHTMKQVTVLTSLTLGFGSHVGNRQPKSYKTYPKGSMLMYESSAANGNVWFIDSANNRGKIEAGHISCLVKSGNLQIEEFAQ